MIPKLIIDTPQAMASWLLVAVRVQLIVRVLVIDLV